MALDYDKTEYTLTYNEEKQKYRLKYSQADVFAVVIAKSLVEAPVEKVDIRIKNSVLHGMTIYPINEGVELNNVKIIFENNDNFSQTNLLVTPNTDFSVKNNKGACQLYGSSGLILDGACSFNNNRDVKIFVDFIRTSATNKELLKFSELKVENCKNTSKNNYSLNNNFANIIFRVPSARNRLNLKNIMVDCQTDIINSAIRGEGIGVDSIEYSNFSIENAKISSAYGIRIMETINTDIKNLELKADASLYCENVKRSGVDIDGLVIGEKSNLEFSLNPDCTKEESRSALIVKNCAIKNNSKLIMWATNNDTRIKLENIDVIDVKGELTAASFTKESGNFEVRDVKEFKIRGRYDVHCFEVTDCDKFELGLNKTDNYLTLKASVKSKNCKKVSLKASNKMAGDVKGTLDLLAINAEVSAKNIEFGVWNSILCCECVDNKIKADNIKLNNSNLHIKGGSEVSDLVAESTHGIIVANSQVKGLNFNVQRKLNVNIEESIVKNVNVKISDNAQNAWELEKISIIDSELSDSEIRGGAKLVNSVISGAVTGPTFEADSASYFGGKDVLLNGTYANQDIDGLKQVKPVEVVKSDKKINDVEL
jgi:hypothetical protein